MLALKLLLVCAVFLDPPDDAKNGQKNHNSSSTNPKMADFCGAESAIVRPDLPTEAFRLLESLPRFEFSTDPDVAYPSDDDLSSFESSAITAFEVMVRRSAPFLVNADTAGILITTFMLLTADSFIFRHLIANAMRIGRFFNNRFETRYQIDNVATGEVRGLNSLALQRDYIRGLTPEGVFVDPLAFEMRNDLSQLNSRGRDRLTRLDITALSSRLEEDLNFINVPTMLNHLPWDAYLQFVNMFAHELTRLFVDVEDSPEMDVTGTIARAIILELTQNTIPNPIDFRQLESAVFQTTSQYQLLQLRARHSRGDDYIYRIADLAYEVNFDSPLGDNERFGGIYRENNYARMSMDLLDTSTPISNPNELGSPLGLSSVRREFRCRLFGQLVTMGRYRSIIDRRYSGLRRERQITPGSSIQDQDFCTHDAGPVPAKCLELNDNLSIVDRQFNRTAVAGEFRKKDYPTWSEYYNLHPSYLRDEGEKMAGRTCMGFWYCRYENYGYVFHDGSFAVGITNLAIRRSDRDNWILENGNTYDDWHGAYNGQILFDRNGRPVIIIMGVEHLIPVFRNVWVYEFTERGDWKWSPEWQPPANKLSKNEGRWFFSLRERRMTAQPDNPWSLGTLNLMSTQKIVEKHCNDGQVDRHGDWMSFYDDMHIKDFDTLKRVLFKDGSYAIGITNPGLAKYDNIGSLMTSFWTVPKVYRKKEKSDYSRGPYFGILVIDRQRRPVLAAFRENTNYISFHYYVDGNWRWAENSLWKEISEQSKGLSLDPKAPRFTLTSCRV